VCVFFKKKVCKGTLFFNCTGAGADVEFFTNDVTVQLMCKKCSNFNSICTTI
jgi:hypothetical protein